MSNDEFDNYLALLSRLLRLGGKQRAAIAGELRAHLEDRLDDLLARGVPREQAVRQALEEFGDAAGLAAEFVSISRNKRRRWLMRLTTASVAAMVLIAAGIVTFWPGRNAGPGAAALVAQPPAAGGQPDSPKPPAIRRKLLADKLGEPTEAEFVETPLKDALAFLANQHEIQIYIKSKRLDEAGVPIDSPVTKSLKNVKLSTLLDLMLEEVNLVYTEKDDVLVITTPDDAQATMEVRVYDCRDLLTMPTGGQARPGMMPPGIPGMPGVGHPPGGFGEDGDVPTFPGRIPPPSDTRPRLPPAGLTPPTSGGASTLPPASADAPTAVGTPPAPAGSTIPRRPRADVLPQAGGLGGLQAGPTVGPPGMGGPGGFQGGGLGMGGVVGGDSRPQRPMSADDLKAEQLMNIITTAVDPGSWADQGGPGTIGQYNGLIVVSQSARTHTKVEKVLDMLREAAGLPKSKTPRVVR